VVLLFVHYVSRGCEFFLESRTILISVVNDLLTTNNISRILKPFESTVKYCFYNLFQGICRHANFKAKLCVKGIKTTKKNNYCIYTGKFYQRTLYGRIMPIL